MSAVMVSPKKPRGRVRKNARILQLVGILFCVTVIAIGSFHFLLRDVHTDKGSSVTGKLGSAVQLQQQQQQQQQQHQQQRLRGNEVSQSGKTKAPTSGEGKQGKKSMSIAEKNERRKALAQSLMKKREEAAKAGDNVEVQVGNQGVRSGPRRGPRTPGTSAADLDWRKEGYSRKPSWWDRYIKVQQKYERDQSLAKLDSGDVLGAAAIALDGWGDDDDDDEYVLLVCLCW